jgi:hypothetical protein
MVRSYGFLFLACCVILVSASGCQNGLGGTKVVDTITQKQLALLGTEITADCVVTFFDDQGGKYISQQHHTIYPQSSAIKIETAEPEGDFEWLLLNGIFTTVKSGSSKSPVTLSSEEIAHAITLSVSSKGGFMSDKSGVMLDTISISGQVYQPIVIHTAVIDTPEVQAGPVSPVKLKIYRDISSDQIDWVEVGNSSKTILYAARSYNLRSFKDTDKFMPTSIDIYNTDKDGRPSDRIMKVEYKSYRLSN